MTVSTTINRASYIGNGVTTVFPFSIQFFANTDLIVTEQIGAGVPTLLTLGTDYTVVGAGTPSGGTVTRTVATANGTVLLIVRSVAATQGVSLPNNTAFDGPTVEAEFDRLTMLAQQNADALSAAILNAAGVTTASALANVPAGNIVAVNVQAALNELDTKKIANALVTVKGDLIGASGNATPVRVAIGADGYALRPSSGVSSGLAWTGPSNFDILNGSLTASVAANALTVALKGLDGNDPSDTNPVFIAFRSVTPATGTPTIIKVVAATSIVVSSGSTLGTSNAVAARLWIVGFNDAGTFRMGIVNCLSGQNIMPLRDNILASSTAEGGAGAADSAQVIYTGTAVAAKAMRILGYLEATEAAAGTWATAPSVLQLFGPGVPLPGSVIQRQRSQDAAANTTTTILPFDDTIPQNTEGGQFMTLAITPVSAANVLSIEHHGLYGANVDTEITSVALFQDATAGALAAVQAPSVSGANGTQGVTTLNHQMLAGTIVSTTFKIRAGPAGANTTTFNGAASARRFGGVAASSLTIQEISA